MNACLPAGRRLFYLLAVGAAICLLGCRKKETNPQTSSQSPPAQAASTPSAAPAPVPPSSPEAAPPAAPDSYEAAVTARSIDHLKGQIVRKDWPKAQRALSQVESRPLTPQQRQYVDSLKAQLPPGK
jgi:hypothetical protein